MTTHYWNFGVGLWSERNQRPTDHIDYLYMIITCRDVKHLALCDTGTPLQAVYCMHAHVTVAFDVESTSRDETIISFAAKNQRACITLAAVRKKPRSLVDIFSRHILNWHQLCALVPSAKGIKKQTNKFSEIFGRTSRISNLRVSIGSSASLSSKPREKPIPFLFRRACKIAT